MIKSCHELNHNHSHNFDSFHTYPFILINFCQFPLYFIPCFFSSSSSRFIIKQNIEYFVIFFGTAKVKSNRGLTAIRIVFAACCYLLLLQSGVFFFLNPQMIGCTLNFHLRFQKYLKERRMKKKHPEHVIVQNIE